MIDHTGLQISDPIVSRNFYDNALAPLGYKTMVQIPKEHTGGAAVLGYGLPPKPDFWVSKGTPNDPRLHIAFRAETHKQVDEFYKAALAAGGKDSGSPGPLPQVQGSLRPVFVQILSDYGPPTAHTKLSDRSTSPLL